MTAMFCLVSRQAMANVLPVFMFNPKKVFLFSTPEEKKSTDNIYRLFNQKNLEVERIDNLNAYDYLSFKKIVNDELKKSDFDVILNVTGGTKLMALAAYEAFAEKEKKIIYCDTVHKKIIQLYPGFNTYELETLISIKDYLQAYGYRITEQKELSEIKKYYPLFVFIESNNLLNSFVKFNTVIKQNLAQTKPKFTVISVDRNFIFQKNYGAFRIGFGNEKNNSFIVNESDFKSGDWLEYFVFYNLDRLKNIVLSSGVKILSENDAENEIDVIALKDFKLHLFSCKSGKKDNQFDLFQLETLRNITSGTFGKGIFVTPNKSSDKFLKRAEELSISVKGLNELKGVYDEK